MSKRRKGSRLAPIAALAAALLLGAGTADAATFGSDLTDTAQSVPDDCSIATAPCTSVSTLVRTGNLYPAAAPIDGVVTRFGIKVAGAAELTFRLVRVAGEEAAGDGTGPTVSLPAAGTYSFPARLRVGAGDVVGFDGSSVAAFESVCGAIGGYAQYFHPTIAEGMFSRENAHGGCGLLVNATVEPDADGDLFGDETQDRCPGSNGPDEGCPAVVSPGPSSPAGSPPSGPGPSLPQSPSNAFGFGKLIRNVKRGTAVLSVVALGPGSFKLSGPAVKSRTARAAAAGEVKLPVLPKGTAKRKLAETGSAKVRLTVAFTPDGGTARTAARTVTLKLQS